MNEDSGHGRRFTAIESFAGAGGMTLGLSAAGFDVRLAFDINARAVETANRNFGEHARVLDARTVSGRDLLDWAGVGPARLDLFSGGPPCQGFSKQRRGAHLLQDERNSLVLEFGRLVQETNARAFIFENVEVFGQKRGGDLIAEVRDLLSDYEIYSFFVCSSDFGLAQRRGRFIMIGIDRSESAAIPVLEKARRPKTIKEVIGHLPPPPSDYSEHPSVPNHIKCRITKENEERFSHVPPGGGWRDIPAALRLPCHQVVDITSGGWPDVYGRLEWGSQCPTLTAGFDSFTRGRYGHPEQNRSLTLREGALLQGFPEDYRFYGNRGDVRLQIGNAVPPPLAQSAGEAVMRALAGEEWLGANGQWPEEYAMLADRDQLLLAL